MDDKYPDTYITPPELIERIITTIEPVAGAGGFLSQVAAAIQKDDTLIVANPPYDHPEPEES